MKTFLAIVCITITNLQPFVAHAARTPSRFALDTGSQDVVMDEVQVSATGESHGTTGNWVPKNFVHRMDSIFL